MILSFSLSLGEGLLQTVDQATSGFGQTYLEVILQEQSTINLSVTCLFFKLSSTHVSIILFMSILSLMLSDCLQLHIYEGATVCCSAILYPYSGLRSGTAAWSVLVYHDEYLLMSTEGSVPLFSSS